MGEEEYWHKPVAAIGQTIVAVTLVDNTIALAFGSGQHLTISDEGQDCCEERFITTDDCLSAFAGATIRDVALKDGGKPTDTEDEVHEVQFLEIVTDQGPITFATHNIHNGYYGGFALDFRWDDEASETSQPEGDDA